MGTGRRRTKRIPFGALLEAGLLQPGDVLYLDGDKATATVQADGMVKSGDLTGSIHQVGARLLGVPALNGWEHWYYRDRNTGHLRPVDHLRGLLRSEDPWNVVCP